MSVENNVHNSNIDKTKIVTQEQLEWAEQKSKTESFEESVWESALDETESYINQYDINVEGLQGIVESLKDKRGDVALELGDVEKQGEVLDETYRALKQKPQFLWTSEDRMFMQDYDQKKKVNEFEKNALTFSLSELNAIVDKKEKEVASNQMKKDIMEAHRDIRVKPKYEKEAKEAQEAYDYWQDLKELAKAQQEELKK